MANQEIPRLPDEGPHEKSRAKQTREFFNNLPGGKRVQSEVFNRVILLLAVTQPIFWKDPEVRKFLLERERQTGLLEGSIIEHELFVPNHDETHLEKREALSGQWAAYDFRRPKEFGKKVKQEGRQHQKGKLLVFDLEELHSKSASEHTPTGYLKFFYPDHFFQGDYLPISTLEEKEYVEKTTYGAAFKKAKMDDVYRTDLASIGEHTVYMVTPKGNGLLFLEPDRGERKPVSESHRARGREVFPGILPI